MSSDSKPRSTYIFPGDSVEETLRLSLQSDLLDPFTGALFPDGFHLSLPPLKRVLDIACGSGGWVIRTAKSHPDVEVVGIDIDESRLQVIRQAVFNAGDDEQTLPKNVDFLRMDALQPLAFEDSSFDVVNACLLASFVPVGAWFRLLRECRRILRPGGVIRLTEMEIAHTNSEAFEIYAAFLTRALQRAGLSFSPTGRDMCVTPMLTPLLREADFRPFNQYASFINFSSGEQSYSYSYQNILAAFKLAQGFLVTQNIARSKKIERIYQKVLAEMRQSTFRGGAFFLTVWAEKPVA
jgi:ubiquinone/menaquinone biosynthesis C-methylase UbiE